MGFRTVVDIQPFTTWCLKPFKDSRQTQILHCIWAESLSNYHIDLLTENFQRTLDRTDIGKMHLTIISAERQRAVTQETLKNYVNGIHLLEDFYRGVKIDMSHSLGDTFDHFIDLSPEYKWIQSSCHCKMLTVQEEILLKNYDLFNSREISWKGLLSNGATRPSPGYVLLLLYLCFLVYFCVTLRLSLFICIMYFDIIHLWFEKPFSKLYLK